jgi:RHS repeat-associated protein
MTSRARDCAGHDRSRRLRRELGRSGRRRRDRGKRAVGERRLVWGSGVYRYYDPQTGQFLTVDPLVDQTAAPYGYGGQDPINGYDLDGTVDTSPAFISMVIHTGNGGFVPFAEGLTDWGPTIKTLVTIPGSVPAFSGGYTLTPRGPSIVTAREPSQSLPKKGKPSSTAVIDKGNGRGQIRDYGSDGVAIKDFDFGHDHTGAGDPHAHDWHQGSRQPPRSIRPGE